MSTATLNGLYPVRKSYSPAPESVPVTSQEVMGRQVYIERPKLANCDALHTMCVARLRRSRLWHGIRRTSNCSCTSMTTGRIGTFVVRMVEPPPPLTDTP